MSPKLVKQSLFLGGARRVRDKSCIEDSKGCVTLRVKSSRCGGGGEGGGGLWVEANVGLTNEVEQVGIMVAGEVVVWVAVVGLVDRWVGRVCGERHGLDKM